MLKRVAERTVVEVDHTEEPRFKQSLHLRAAVDEIQRANPEFVLPNQAWNKTIVRLRINTMEALPKPCCDELRWLGFRDWLRCSMWHWFPETMEWDRRVGLCVG